MFLILITTILLTDKLLMLFHTSGQIKNAGRPLQRYGQKITLQRLFYLLILGLLLLLWTYLSYFSPVNQVAFILYGIYLWIYIFYKFQKIKVFEKGMIVQGYYIAWSRVESIKVDADHTVIINYGDDTLEFKTLKKVKEADHFKALYEKYKDSTEGDEKFYDDNPLIDFFVTKIINFREKNDSK